MATAICEQCGDILYWRAQRGVRLADFICRKCGGAYKAATWTPEGWRPRDTHSLHKGKDKVACLCCGRQTPLREKAARTVKMVMSNIGRDARRWAQTIWTIQINEGDPICSRCRPWECLSTGSLNIETYDWLYRQIDGVGVNYAIVADDI